MPTTIRPSVRYSLSVIQEEVRYLIDRGVIARSQRLYMLWQYFPVSEWEAVVNELEERGFLLRDRITDLLTNEVWLND